MMVHFLDFNIMMVEVVVWTMREKKKCADLNLIVHILPIFSFAPFERRFKKLNVVLFNGTDYVVYEQMCVSRPYI